MNRSRIASVSIRKLFAILVAIAVLFTPGLTAAALASAPNHNMQLMQGGHCEAPPSNTDHRDKMAGKSCCISMCTAVAVAPAGPVIAHEIAAVPPNFTIRELHLAYLGEIATPPPRAA